MTAEQLIAGVREAATALVRSEPEDHEIADAAGMVREIEVMLGDWRRSIERRASEQGPISKPEPTVRVEKPRGTPEVVAQGKHWELEPQYKTTYTFNTPRLFHDFAEGAERTIGAPLPTPRLIMQLEKVGALEIRWKVTGLKAAAKLFDVTLNTGTEAVEADMESPHVGKVKKQTGVKRVPLREGIE